MLSALHARSNDPPSLVTGLIDEWNRTMVYQHLQRRDADNVLNIPLSSRNLDEE